MASAELQTQARDVAASWVAAENFHVTVKFLGAVDEARIPAIADALCAAAARHRAFEIDVEGLGAFPVESRPRVLWAGVGRGADALSAVASSVEHALAGVGFVRAERPFTAHITLARVRVPRRDPALARALAAATTRPLGRSPVDAIALMRSDLSPRGARYSTLVSARFEL